MHVITLTNRDRLREFLLTDRFFADYARGDLDPAHFPYTEWFGVEEAGELCTVVMLYNDLQPPIFFTTGEAGGIEAILDQAVKLPQIGLSIREEHLPAVEKFYRTEPVPMLKMALLAEDFRPVEAVSLRGALSPRRVRRIAPATRWACAPPRAARLGRAARPSRPLLQEIASRSALAMARLDASYMPQLEALYAHGGGDAFRQRSLELGVFYGVFDDGCLVSVAGTHIVSDHERIAALGNVMTHPAYRGQGLATAATSAVCGELLDRGIEMIGLSVSRANEAAIRVYEKLGFKRKVPFLEGTATRLRRGAVLPRSKLLGTGKRGGKLALTPD